MLKTIALILTILLAVMEVKGVGRHQNAIFCTLHILKNILKADFLLVFERGNAAKYLVGSCQSHSCFDG